MIYIFVVIGVILADQFTKMWIIKVFYLSEVKEIIPGLFNLVYATNRGAAFSMFADINSPWTHYFFLGVGGVAMVGLTFAAWKLKHMHSWYPVALALIAGGAAGNIIDRIRYGSVVDFLDFFIGRYHWPAFNIADSAICIGAGLFLIINLMESRKEKRG